MQYNDIVKFNGELGRVITYGNEFKFHPMNYGTYFPQELETITEKTVKLTSFEEKIEFITKTFTWGRVVDVHTIGEYQFVAYIRDRNVLFSSFINFNSICHSEDSLDKALIGVIAHKVDGCNSRAAEYFTKMIGL